MNWLGEINKINLGCGYRQLEGYINIDNRKCCNPDLLCNVINGLPFSDSSMAYVRAYDFLEHIPIGKTIDVIEEIWRVLEPNGLFESMTPDAERGQGAFQDPTHVSFWVKNSWLYYSHLAYRQLYNIKANFQIETLDSVQQIDESVFHLHVIAKAIK